jgi:PncC family amidohydrolase
MDAPSPSLAELAQRLQSRCLSAGMTVTTAESCTGGLVAHAITGQPGSSGYFLGGVVSYSNAVKSEVLGVPADLIAVHGAVSAQVAVAMAAGVRARLASDLAVGVTGVAGPDGGSDDKPVGLVYVAVSDRLGADVRRYHWTGDRASNNTASAAAALALLLERADTAAEAARASAAPNPAAT